MRDPVFIIDTARCTGCQACSIACKDRADLPDELDWLRVEAIERGTYPRPTLIYRVTHCFHCARPPCADVCPTGAMSKTADGRVQVDAELCIACGACVDACPFGAIAIGPEAVAIKCDGCADQVTRGQEPTCVRACPMRALAYAPFGDALPGRRARDTSFDDHGIGPAVTYLVATGASD